MQQPVSTFDQEQSDHWEVLADIAYYQDMAMMEEMEEDNIPSGCQQINTTQSEEYT